MLRENSIEHVKRVLAFAKHQTLIPSPIARIARSWERCLQDYHLDPATRHETVLVERQLLQEQQQQVREWLGDFVTEEMIQLYQRMSDSGYSVILTDKQGVILNYVGDPNLEREFYQAGLRLGAVWTEAQEGTNGIGTCLFEKEPITVYRDEHFRSRHIQLTCSAAPIFDSQGELLAVLDVSSVNTQDSKAIHQHTASLVSLSAKLIENHSFLQQWQKHWIVRFHSKSHHVAHVNEGLIALNEGGQILAVNQNTLNWLSLKRHEILGHSFTEFFDVSLADLVDCASRQLNNPCTLRQQYTGRLFYSLIRIPVSATCVRLATHVFSPETPAVNPAYLGFSQIAGKDQRMENNVRFAQKVMNKGIPILLYGETGTGKEAFAKAIHHASARADKPFVALNCAAIPESLIESELFGYKHGAFTGARKEGMRGKILQSHEGTLFLDEIGDMPLSLQTRLLRVLEEQEVVPLGGENPIPVKLSLISATHRNLQELIEKGSFREDLYYRLNSLTLHLPALRERDDISYLIQMILWYEGHQEHVDIEINALQCLTNYHWRGNIRQLRNVLRTALALRSQPQITLHDLPPEIVQYRPFNGDTSKINANALINIPRPFLPATPLEMNDLGSSAGDTPLIVGQEASDEEESELDHELKFAEKNALLRALERHHWNITNTANSLHMSRNTLYRKMKKHGIGGQF